MEFQHDRRLRVCIVVPPGGSVDPIAGVLAGEGLEMVAVPSVKEAATESADAYLVDIDGGGVRGDTGGVGRASGATEPDPTVVAELRAATSAAILALSRVDDPQVRLACFAAGADDYLSHAWSLGDLAPRVRLRASARSGGRGTAGVPGGLGQELAFTPDGHALVVRGRQVALTPRERELLALLISRPQQLVTRDELLTSIWGGDWSSEGVVTEYVRRIRNSLRPHGADGCLVTRHRYGYLWDPERLVDI